MRKYPEPVPGQKFNDWTVLEKSSEKKYHYVCQCKCGFQSTKMSYLLHTGKSKKCKKCNNKLNGIKNKKSNLNKANNLKGIIINDQLIKKVKEKKRNNIFIVKCLYCKKILHKRLSQIKKYKCRCNTYGENCHYSRLNENDIKSIRFLIKQNIYTSTEIREMFNLTYTNLYLIKNNLSWKHVD